MYRCGDEVFAEFGKRHQTVLFWRTTVNHYARKRGRIPYSSRNLPAVKVLVRECVCEIHAVSKTLVIPGIGIDSMPMGRDRQLRELSMHVTKKCGEIRNRKSDYSRWCYRSCTLDFWRHSVLYGLMYVNLNRILVWCFCIMKPR